MTIKALQVQYKGTDEVLNARLDMQGKLESGETLTGTPTVTIIGGSTLIVISSISVSTGALTVNGSTCSAGQVIQFVVTGGVANTRYVLKALASTTAGQTIGEKCPLIVEAST
jgi:hypothetical protein